MANTQYSNITNEHTSLSDVTKLHDRYEGGRHTYGHEYGKTTRIKFGDHVRIGGEFGKPDKATAYGSVTL